MGVQLPRGGQSAGSCTKAPRRGRGWSGRDPCDPGKFTFPPIISVGFPSVLCGESRRREENLSGVLQPAGLEEGGRRKAHLEAAPLLLPSPQPQPGTQLWSFFQTSAWNVRSDPTPLTQGPSPGPAPAQGPLMEAVGPCSVLRD